MLSGLRTVIFIRLFGFILLFINVSINAETTTNPESHRINLREAINRTFEYNPALRTFSYQLKAQNGRELQAGFAASPEISFTIEDAFGTGQFKGLDSAQATLSIGWVIEGEVRQSYIDAAQAETLSLTAESNIKRLDAAAETARLYLVCLANQARLVNTAKTVELAKEAIVAVKKRVSAGKTPEAELARAQAEVARRQLDNEDIEHELSSSIRRLAAQWGDLNPVFTNVTGDISPLPDTITFDALKTQLEQSPEYALLFSDKRVSQAQLKLAKAQSSPNWRVNVGVRHFESSNDQALVAGIAIPFGERSRNSGGIAEAQANLSRTDAETDALKVRLETSLYVLYQELKHSMHKIKSYRDEIIPGLEKAFKETRRAYNLGRYSYLEWRSVQADLLDARSALVETSIDAHLKIVEIERLTGVSMTQLATKQ